MVYTMRMNISLMLSLYEMKVHYPLRFAFYKTFYKVDKNRILFADPYSTDLTDNMKPIYTALKAKDGVTLVKCFPQSEGLKGNSLGEKIKGRANRSASFNKFIKEYARSGIVFLTESYLPAYAVTPRPETKVVQLWHGSGAFKKWGYSTLDKSFGASDNRIPMHNCYSLVPVSSKEVTRHYAEAFGCSEDIIKPLGVPRTDELINNRDNTKESFLKDHPEFKDKKLILYAPTFRGNNIVDAKNGIGIDLEAFCGSLKDEILLLKLHPFIKGKVEIPGNCKGKCLDISDYETNTALKIADLLITDYSSIIFEYSLLEKPMVFYAYDLDDYKGNRDFYYPYEDFVPGPIVKAQEELVEAIHKEQDIAKIKEFKNKYMDACDGKCTDKILKELLA